MNVSVRIYLEGTEEEVRVMMKRIRSLEPYGDGYLEMSWDKDIPYEGDEV